MDNTKKCNKCGRELPLECFSKCKRSKDGLQSWCKECVKQYFKQWRTDNADERKQYNKQYFKQYYTDNREEKLEYQNKYYTEHSEEIKQYKKQCYATIEGYAYNIRCANLQADRKYGRCGKDEDILPPLDYYIWALQQRDFYDWKQYHWSEMGLDRIYTDKPHTFANVVPCSTANNIRRHRKSFGEFCELMRNENEELTLACG